MHTEQFGIAKAANQLHARTRTGEIKGKLAYIPPEQVLGHGIDRRVDIYAMGCVLYVTTLEEAAAADAAGVDMLSIEGRFFSPEMREAAGRCFVQVGLPYGPAGNLVTAEDYF